jgi:hypothetical protein
MISMLGSISVYRSIKLPIAELRQGAKPPAVRIATFLGLFMCLSNVELKTKNSAKVIYPCIDHKTAGDFITCAWVVRWLKKLNVPSPSN